MVNFKPTLGDKVVTFLEPACKQIVRPTDKHKGEKIMKEIETTLKEIGSKSGLDIALDENGSCTLELADGRVIVLQERADLNELDFVANLGTVPEEVRAEVFTALLAANFYWNETLGATLSWNADLEEAVLIYPLPLADATPESIETIFKRFVELQAAWSDRLAGLVAVAQEDDDGEPDEDDGEAPNDGLIINP